MEAIINSLVSFLSEEGKILESFNKKEYGVTFLRFILSGVYRIDIRDPCRETKRLVRRQQIIQSREGWLGPV